MTTEAPILIFEQHCEITRIDILDGGWKPPASFRGCIGPQQPAIAVDDERRIFDGVDPRQWSERDDPPGKRAHRGQDDRGEACKNEPAGLHGRPYFADWISIAPVAVRP